MRRHRNRPSFPVFAGTCVLAFAGCVTNYDVAPTQNTDTGAADVSEDIATDAAGSGDVAPSGCDMTGFWAVKASPYALDAAFSQPQRSNNWYYFEVVDRGDEIEIVDGFDCGIRVEGLASVTITEATTVGLMRRNSPIGRRGVFRDDGAGGCEFSLDRFWWIRGAEDQYLPDDFTTEYLGDDAISEIDADIPLPTEEDPTGADDPENDGALGMAYQVGGAATGTRNVIQRDWNEFFSTAERHPTPETLDDFESGFDYDSTEVLLSVTGCDPGFGCGVIATESAPDPNGDHHARFVRVGSDFRQDEDIETCYAVQDLIPFEEP